MSDRRRARTALGDEPDSAGATIVYRNLLRQNVAMNHGLAEGVVPDHDTVWRSYDRAEHPLLHGRRAHDLIERAKEVLSRGE